MGGIVVLARAWGQLARLSESRAALYRGHSARGLSDDGGGGGGVESSRAGRQRGGKLNFAPRALWPDWGASQEPASGTIGLTFIGFSAGLPTGRWLSSWPDWRRGESGKLCFGWQSCRARRPALEEARKLNQLGERAGGRAGGLKLDCASRFALGAAPVRPGPTTCRAPGAIVVVVVVVVSVPAALTTMRPARAANSRRNAPISAPNLWPAKSRAIKRGGGGEDDSQQASEKLLLFCSLSGAAPLPARKPPP